MLENFACEVNYIQKNICNNCLLSHFKEDENDDGDDGGDTADADDEGNALSPIS